MARFRPSTRTAAQAALLILAVAASTVAGAVGLTDQPAAKPGINAKPVNPADYAPKPERRRGAMAVPVAAPSAVSGVELKPMGAKHPRKASADAAAR